MGEYVAWKGSVHYEVRESCTLYCTFIAVDARSSPSYRKQAKLMKEAIQRIQARSLQNLFNTRLERLQRLVFTGVEL